jgi:hypothetical protein
MLQIAYLLAKIGADTAENERNFAEILPKSGNYPTGAGRNDASCSETIKNISIDEKPRPSSGGLEKEGLTIGAAHEDEKRTVGRPGMKKRSASREK